VLDAYYKDQLTEDPGIGLFAGLQSPKEDLRWAFSQILSVQNL